MHPHRKDTAVQSQVDMHAVNFRGWCCPSRFQKAAVVGPAPSSCLASGSCTGHQDTQTLLCSPTGSVPHQQSRHEAPAGLFRERGLLSRIQEPGPCTWSGRDSNGPTRHPSSRRSVRDSFGLHGHGGPTLTLPAPQKPEGGQSPPLQAEPPAALVHKTP